MKIEITNSKNESKEQAWQIMEVFEDFLAEKGVDIASEEKLDAIRNGEPKDCLGILYGSDYYELEDAIVKILSEAKNESI